MTISHLSPDEKRRLLQDLLDRKAASDRQALSFVQQDIFFEPALNLGSVYRVSYRVEPLAWREAARSLVRRHQILRVRYPIVDGRPRAETVDDLDFEILEGDATTARSEVDRPFDLEARPPFRVRVVRESQGTHLLVLVLHHIAGDVTSCAILVREMLEPTQALVNPAAEYWEFAAWQRDRLASPEGEADRRYWESELSQGAEVLFRSEEPRPARAASGDCPVRVSTGLAQAARQLAREEGTTLYAVLLSAYQILLSRWSQQTHFWLATSTLGRTQARFEHVVGCFADLLAVRADLRTPMSCRRLLQAVHSHTQTALQHQNYPSGHVVEKLRQVVGEAERHPIRVDFNWLERTAARSPWGAGVHRDLGAGRSVEIVYQNVAILPGHLSLGFSPDGDALTGVFSFCESLFERRTVQAMAADYLAILQEVVSEPDGSIRPAHPTPAPTESLLSRFHAQAAGRADAIALIQDERRLTFAELATRVGRLGQALQDLGVQPGDVVVLALPRSIESVLAMLGILSAGACFLPLAAEPSLRDLVLADSQARFAVSDAPIDNLECLLLLPTTDLTGPATLAAPATHPYLMYTSGSSGRPKGVLGTSPGLLNRIDWMQRVLPFAADEVGCHKTPLTFVDSVWEVFGPLLCGVPLVIVPDATVHDVPAFLHRLRETRVSRLVLVPSYLRMLLTAVPDLLERLPHLTCWISSGEALPSDIAVHFKRAGRRLLNVYGCTEVAADVTWFDTSADWEGSVPIGRPIDNVQVHLLDDDMQPATEGEICISGVALAAGYWHRPLLTRERFGSGPDGVRVYRTGDVGRWRTDGVVEYLGRRDRQVKVNGQRIELDGIEARVQKIPGVRAAGVTAVVAADGGTRLVGWYEGSASPAEVAAYCRTALPVPVSLESVSTVPTLPSGKIDRSSPGSYIDIRLQGLWEEALGRAVNPHDNFFELGGHSLMAIALMARIETVLGVKLPLASLLAAPTLAGQSSLLSAAVEQRVLVPVQKRGSRRPLFIANSAAGEVLAYWNLARRLGPEQPVHVFQIHNVSINITGLAELARLYLQEMRQVQPCGPYRLGGLSIGGLIAYDMAQQLRAAGEEVELLVLFDTKIPVYRWKWVRQQLRQVRRAPLAESLRALRKGWHNRRYTAPAAIPVQETVHPLPPFLQDQSQWVQMVVRYPLRPYRGTVVLIRAEALPRQLVDFPLLGWDAYVSPPPALLISPGYHAQCILEPHVGAVAEFLQSYLAG